jgi:hypothetical protein
VRTHLETMHDGQHMTGGNVTGDNAGRVNGRMRRCHLSARRVACA